MMVIVLGIDMYPQFITACTFSVPLVQAGPKFTCTLVPVVLMLSLPLVKVALPVIVHR